MLKRAVRHIHEHRQEGDILMDVPENMDWEELTTLTSEKDTWKAMVRAVKETNTSKWQRMSRVLKEIQTSKEVGARYARAVEAAAKAAAEEVR